MSLKPEKHMNILVFMFNYYEKYGFPPNLREFCEGCGYTSTSVMSYHLRMLGSQDYIHKPHPTRPVWMLTAKGRKWAQMHKSQPSS